MMAMRSAAVIGAGYVGLTAAVVLAERGFAVIGVESDPDRLALLVSGASATHEPELDDAVGSQVRAGRLAWASQLPVDRPDLVVICVGTPPDQTGMLSTKDVDNALGQALPAVERGAACVVRSTLPIDWSPGPDWAVSALGRLFVVPEFLRQGSSLLDSRCPSRVIVGTFTQEPDPAALALAYNSLAPTGTAILTMTSLEARLVKLASNAYLANRLAFANELAVLTAELGGDVGPVLAGLSLDPRVGAEYLSPAYGFGGSCLPKDVHALELAGRERGVSMHITSAISRANAAHQQRFAWRISVALGGLAGKRIGVLGLAYKAGTDDVRSSPALNLAAALIGDGAEVLAHDPVAGAAARRMLVDLVICDDPGDVFVDADAVVVATEWPAYVDLDWPGLIERMRSPLLFDGRRILPVERLSAMGYRVDQVGRGQNRKCGSSFADGSRR